MPQIPCDLAGTRSHICTCRVLQALCQTADRKVKEALRPGDQRLGDAVEQSPRLPAEGTAAPPLCLPPGPRPGAAPGGGGLSERPAGWGGIGARPPTRFPGV